MGILLGDTVLRNDNARMQALKIRLKREEEGVSNPLHQRFIRLGFLFRFGFQKTLGVQFQSMLDGYGKVFL